MDVNILPVILDNKYSYIIKDIDGLNKKNTRGSTSNFFIKISL